MRARRTALSWGATFVPSMLPAIGEKTPQRREVVIFSQPSGDYMIYK
jgi:hypothetical protein